MHLQKKTSIQDIKNSLSLPNSLSPVLVIDDVKTNLLLARNQLEQLGIDCDTAGDGVQALEKLESKTYSVILVDCSMPGMDGFEFTRRYREMEKKSGIRIPVIAMTAHVVAGIKERCLEAGMDDYVSKPVRLETLTAKLGKWIVRN